MTGKNYNNRISKSKAIISNKAGQVLLIIVMLLATAITIVLAVTFRSTTDTQLTKLEEDNQKALAAAQAGIEEALRTGSEISISSGSLNIPSGFSGNAKFSTETKQSFITPVLHQDEQYTFYLTDYTNGVLGVNSNTIKPLLLYLQSETGCPAAEITILAGVVAVKKFLVDPCSLVTNGSGANVLNTNGPPTLYTPTGESIPFKYQTAAGELSYTTEKLMIVRVLFSNTRVGVESTGAITLPTQGKTVVSEVRSPSGVSKKISLFQSYPQIPADFFVTSF